MPRAIASRTALLKVEGTEDVLGNISQVVNMFTGQEIRRLYMAAAMAVRNEARSNIDGISSDRLDERGKLILKEMVIGAYGPDQRKQNVIIGVSAVKARKLARTLGPGKSVRYPNPYWFEFGTVERQTANYFGKGTTHSTGHITATPFFRPAVSSKRAEVRAILTSGLRQILNVEIERKLKMLRSAHGASSRGTISTEITRLEGLYVP